MPPCSARVSLMIHDDRDDVAEYRQVRIRSEATALTIAGFGSERWSWLQADLKTFHQLGVYGTSVVTLLTVQTQPAFDISK